MLTSPAAGCLVFLQESPSQALRKQETQKYWNKNAVLKQHDHTEVQCYWQRHTPYLPCFNYDPFPLQFIPLQSQLPNIIKKLLVLQEAHFTAYTTFILRPDLFWTTNHTRVLWKQLNIIYLVIKIRITGHTHVPCEQSLHRYFKISFLTFSVWSFLCGEIFNVEKFSLWRSFLCGEIFCVPIYRAENNPNILTPIKKTLNVKPQAKRKFIAWHYTDIYRLSNWPSFLVPIGTVWSLGLRQ